MYWTKGQLKKMRTTKKVITLQRESLKAMYFPITNSAWTLSN